MTIFPSVEHWELIKQARQSGLGTRERQQYHAYDYGWRRVVLDDYRRTSPIDPEGQHFDPAEVDRTEGMWRRHFNVPKPGARRPRDETPPPGTSAEDAARFRAQWDELARLRPAAEAEHRAGIEKGGPALLAYAEAAFRIVRENVALWDRQRRAGTAEAGASADELDDLQRELGVRARESLPLAKAGVVAQSVAPADMACPWLEQGGAELDRLTDILHGKATSKGG